MTDAGPAQPQGSPGTEATRTQSGTWVVLGAGSILQRPGYGCAGYALHETAGDTLTLFDCGPGTLRSLVNCGFELEQIRRVVITHFHLDHVLDLFALAYARRNPGFHKGELELIGPSGFQAFIEQAGRTLGSVQRGFDGVRYFEVDPGTKIVSKDFPEYSLSTLHTHHNQNSLSWRVDLTRGGSVCYSGDVGEDPALADLAHQVDLFCCECSFPEELAQPNHLHPQGAARLAAKAECAKLLLTHFYPTMDPERARDDAGEIYTGPIELAHDGSRHSLWPTQNVTESKEFKA